MATTTTMSTPQKLSPPPASRFLEDNGVTGAASCFGQHFLDECSMCGRHLPGNRDIYMYKGDMPFCTDFCRFKQIRIDEYLLRVERMRAKAAASRSPSESAEEVQSLADAVVAMSVYCRWSANKKCASFSRINKLI